MNNKIQIIILLGYLLSACNVTPKNQNNTLVPYLLTDNGVNSKIKLSEIITRHYRIIPLETKAKCLVGKIDKIIKRDSVFYILSNERKIETFNQEGKHLSTLEKIGRGPDEYTYIGDFDVYSKNGQKEIWLCDMNCIKIYNAETMQHVKSIYYPFVVNKFKKTPDNYILLMTGQNKSLISLSDPSGNIIDSCVNTKVTNTMLKPVQFIPYKDKFIYQIDMTNSCVSYDPEHKQFQEKFIVNTENNWLSELQYDALFQEHEYGFLKYLKNYTFIKTLRYMNKKLYIVSHKDKKRYLHILSNSKQQTIQFAPNTRIINDIFSSDNNLNFISSLNMGESDDSILLILEPSVQDIRQIKRESDSQRIISKINENDNPVILEYY